MAIRTANTRGAPSAQSHDYVVPIIHTKVPAPVADGAFWALAGVALAGVIDPPLAALVAATFLIARRRRGVPST
ncbi:MAG: hypothetical protein M3256_26145 [Actinomycetota bacterium]|nr:hypothetical protein [Actinomycetota bacterium]MDQ6949634.1 hypothetical protein [Actinomycetota bacterium]